MSKPVTTPEERLEAARADLARVSGEQHAKLDAAREAFFNESTELNALGVASSERVALLMIEAAERVVKGIESEIAETRRAALRSEMEELLASKLSRRSHEKIAESFANKGAMLRKQIFALEHEIYVERDRLAAANRRLTEICDELGETPSGLAPEGSLHLFPEHVSRVTNARLKELLGPISRVVPAVDSAWQAAIHP